MIVGNGPAQGYLDEMPATYAGTLNALYKQTIGAIREWDSRRRLLLNRPTGRAHARLHFLKATMTRELSIFFHMYAPPAVTTRGLNRSRFAYPGVVKNWPDSKWGDSIYWDKETIRSLLGEVKNWQIKHRVADQNILARNAIFSMCSTFLQNSNGVGPSSPFALKSGMQ
jgi:hypothetical protein